MGLKTKKVAVMPNPDKLDKKLNEVFFCKKNEKKTFLVSKKIVPYLLFLLFFHRL